jgi:hypothetical protein
MKKQIIFHLSLDIFHLVICRSVRGVTDEVSTACVSRWVKASTLDVFDTFRDPSAYADGTDFMRHESANDRYQMTNDK